MTETHIHADYVSGSRELADRTGATLYLSDEGEPAWKYVFAHQPNVRLVRHGDAIRVGNIRLDVVRTPGHTPEHISFVLTDEPASREPLGTLTGDFVFVGDVGRPDLLERAAHVLGTMEQGARTFVPLNPAVQKSCRIGSCWGPGTAQALRAARAWAACRSVRSATKSSSTGAFAHDRCGQSGTPAHDSPHYSPHRGADGSAGPGKGLFTGPPATALFVR